jgi:hypothetical protein
MIYSLLRILSSGRQYCSHADYAYHDSWCYKLTSSTGRYSDMQTECESDGGTLVVIQSEEKTTTWLDLLDPTMCGLV